MARLAGVLVVAACLAIVGVATSAEGNPTSPRGEPYAQSRVSRTVDGIRFSFKLPLTRGLPWQNGPNIRTDRGFVSKNIFISRDIGQGQDAEAVIFWTGFPVGGQAAPCASLRGSAIGRSTGALAASMAAAPGTELVEGPTRVTVGGRPARRVVLTVRRDLGCDPGFLFAWHPRGLGGECWGACWLESRVGDKISVWIIGVGGKRLVVEAATRVPRNGLLEREIAKIVRSIRFH